MSKLLVNRSYQNAVKQIGMIYGSAQKTLVRACWEIGKRIVEIEQDGRVHAQYGTKLLENLSKDLSSKHGSGFSRTNLIRMRQFYLANQKCSTLNNLTWSKQVILLPVEDSKVRMKLGREALKKNLSARELKHLVKITAPATSKSNISTLGEKLLSRPKGLVLDTYTLVKNPAVITSKDKIVVDCGFHIFRSVNKKTKIFDKSSHTYPGVIDRVVDGDTLKVLINVGFGTIASERLRLRGINTPEMDTFEGKKAKAFVNKVLKPGQTIVIKTYKTDIYGRFVADVLYEDKSLSFGMLLSRVVDVDMIINSGIYLNNQLLKEGFAKRI